MSCHNTKSSTRVTPRAFADNRLSNIYVLIDVVIIYATSASSALAASLHIILLK